MWGRLGYPRRAMRLHACAVAIVERHGGEVPPTSTSCWPCRASAPTPAGRWRPSRTGSGTRSWTPTCDGWWPGPSRASRTPAPPPPPPTWPRWPSCCPRDRRARRPGQHRLHGAGRPGLHRPGPALPALPVRGGLRLAGERAAPPAGPSRKRQRYAGTDRQVRGLLLEVLRHTKGPVPRQRLDLVWQDELQRARAPGVWSRTAWWSPWVPTTSCWPATPSCSFSRRTARPTSQPSRLMPSFAVAAGVVVVVDQHVGVPVGEDRRVTGAVDAARAGQDLGAAAGRSGPCRPCRRTGRSGWSSGPPSSGRCWTRPGSRGRTT